MALSFEKVNYQDGVTVIGAKNLNDIQDAVNELDREKQDSITIDTEVVKDGENPVTGGAVYSIVNTAFAHFEGTGAVVSFDDGADGIPFKRLEVELPILQEGSGNPSVSNVRPFVGYSAAQISRSRADGSTELLSESYDLGRTVYKGILDLVTGVLTVTDGIAALTSSTGFSYNSGYSDSNLSVFYASSSTRNTLLPGLLTVEDSAVSSEYYYKNRLSACSHLIQRPASGAGVKYASSYAINCGPSGYLWVTVPASTATNASGLNAWFKTQNNAGTPVRIVYPLAEPLTYQLTPTELTTLLGDNRVWTDVGELTLSYRADPTLLYTKLANAIVSLGGNI